jgi:glutamine amidotransferase
VVVIDYDAGNIRSVETVLARLGASFVVTREPNPVRNAERVIIPGDGEARASMDVLARRGFIDVLDRARTRGVPILGICIGAQIVLDRSEESDTTCLGFIPGVARRFSGVGGLKVPHMGWNTIRPVHRHPIIAGIPPDASFYFVHSYYPDPADRVDTVAECEYGETFSAVIARENVVATQFHPEKSGEFGVTIVENFLSWTP